jgi:hypothetical protein
MNSNNSKNNKPLKFIQNTSKINKITNTTESNNEYLKLINDEKALEKNDKRIKEIELEIKKKREERQKKMELIQNSRNKELLKLEIKLLRKLYGDLFISLPNTFKQNDLSFENFVYEFGEKIHSLFNLEQNNKNNSYDNLLKEVNILILKKYPISPDLAKFNKKELNKYFYELGINDEWSLLQKYQHEMDKIEEKNRLIKIAQSMKDYYNDLDKQIENKKIIIEKEKEKKEKKNKIYFEKMKIINKQKIEKLKKNEKMMELMDKNIIEQINENDKLKKYYLQNLENENDNINENNYHLIKFKLDNAINIQTKQMQNYNQKFFDYSKNNIINTGYSIPDEQISSMVDQIINKKKEKINIENILENEKDNIKYDNKINYKIEGIDYEIEKKVNKILAEQNLKRINK